MMRDTDTMKMKTDELPNGLRLRVWGDINYRCSAELRVALGLAARKRPARLEVDLSGVGYMDSSGVATLVEALQSQRAHGHELILCGLQPKVRSIFEISRLQTVFNIAADTEAA